MSRFEKWAVFGTAFLTGLTGIGLLWTKYLLTSDDPWSVVNHPLQPLFLKAHILAAPALIFALGMITFRHIWAHYREGLPRGRRSGIVTALVSIPMVASGYLIQVVTAPGWLRFVAVLHIVTSGLFLLGLAAHQLAMRERAARNGLERRSRIGVRWGASEPGDGVDADSGAEIMAGKR
ncbi:MAG: hypothetical protein GWN99_16485 [Gemmatimonadetes bacterium]|uniref:DUF4405 domain-containing protein n=1 Tax=Candidatus Kutchimonas denitrificans TaxID=3056748 RepID=A0AAE5CAA5_9BACT|nr:hypothetical protein [Gemmatimonadota bacterium]NIR74387.1 hypothetical protein [Candidatus Kutchimonas denitrificans]NIS02638.1 hypothetical protein [Gemmatimonadota bacterium]NIT68513.1 hypothetical protein [Gemmatimonadota bacterium]NIU51990.1 hypothetical protein [Gemmatimonadota bacterium]